MKTCWLILLLVLCGCGLPPEMVTAELGHVRLELAPTPDLTQGFRLELWPEGDGAVCIGQMAGGPRLYQRLTPEELARLTRDMSGVDAAALGDGDCGDPESNVLYTRLEVCWQGQTRISHWRGLPPAQAKVAQALLASPIGPTLQEGLKQVQLRKAALR